MASPRDALITGIGLVSCLGEGIEAHWAALNRDGGFQPVVDTTSFAPWPVHPMTPLELDQQIPKRGDQRQMEAWQRIGIYAAGLALDSAGVKGNADLLSRMDMIVAAGGGERDYAVDAAILSALPAAADPGAFLNEHLLSDLRPTLFLAQLSNLLAGNISIVHGVVGSSRTFMGEEAVRHRRGAHRLRPHRRRPGRSVPGRRLLQRAAARRAAALRDGPAAVEAAIRRRLGAPGAGRRHGAWLGRLLPGDREPRARRGARRHGRWRISPRSPPIAAGGARRGDGERRRASSPRCAHHLEPRACGGDLRRVRRAAPPRPRRQSSCAASACRCAPPPRRSAIRWSRRSRPIWRWRRCRCRSARLFAPLEAARGADGRRSCARCW